MARRPVTEEELVATYGPHLNVAPPGGWNAGLQVDREVETHCCFCGQQCGIKLKVADDQIVGFEPWYDFPFNEGKLCPKGVKRYLQGNHPDRLLDPLERDASVPGGFRTSTWDATMERTVAEIQRIQSIHGKDSFALLSGVSLTNEKSYLIGKFARLALQTANLDYNGRLCMVSAGAANKKALGMDRAPNPWSDIPLADVVFLAGANVAECAPITTSYIWRARDRGAKLIVADPRVTPIARTADVFLGLKPGTDSALMDTILHVLIANDWLDHEFIEHHTTGFDDAAAAVVGCTPEWGARICSVPADRIIEAARLWGTSATGMLLHARGIEHHTKGVENVLSCINLGLATGKYGTPGSGVSTITGQGNGQGGREQGHKCDQLPGNRDVTNPEHRDYVASVWGCDVEEIPGKGLTAQEIIDAILDGEIKGLLSICFNPVVSLPDTKHTAAALEKLEFYTAIDFFLSESAQYADVVFPGSLQEEDEGTTTSVEGRAIKINAAIPPPGNARRDWEIFVELADRLGRGKYFPYTSTREMFDEMKVASHGGTADYNGMTWERIEAEHGIFWPCPEEGHPGTPRLYEGGVFAHPDGRAKFFPVTYRDPAEVVDEEYPVWLTTGRVVSQYLSGTQTRRIAPLVEQYPEPLCEMHPRLAAGLGVSTGDLVTVSSRRGTMTLAANVVESIRPDTVFIPYHWAGDKAANQLTNPALDPISKIPEYKVCAVRVEKAAGHVEIRDRRVTTLRERNSESGGILVSRVMSSIVTEQVFVIDQSRCIGCEACVQACEECGTHRGESLIHLEFVDRGATTQTAPMVCMHCEDPTCAEVCPADAIKQNEAGIVQSALKPRCIGCSNCVLACPFGVPKYFALPDQMMKCDMCYDRTSVGLAPMCASVCPSEALWYGTEDEFSASRSGQLLHEFRFGNQIVPTKVATVVDDTSFGPVDVMGAADMPRWQDDPFALDEGDTVIDIDPTGTDPTDPESNPDGHDPLWRDEFPLTSAGEELVARRDFTRYLLTASGVFAAGTVGAAAWATLQSANVGEPRRIVELEKVPEGSEYLFRYPTGDDPAILVHLPGQEFRAYSQKCTHLGCVVFYQSDQDRLFCPCHEGVFDPLSGDPTAGPPERPLTRIEIENRNGVIWAKGVQES